MGAQDPYLILDALSLTLQLLNCLLQLSDLDFGFLHAVPVKLGTGLKLPVLGGNRGDAVSGEHPTFDL